MDSETHKNLISRIRQSELDEEEQEEAIRLVKQERRSELPSATVQVAGEEDAMGGSAKLSLGEEVPVEVPFPDGEDEDGETVYENRTVYLNLQRLNDEHATGAGDGSASAYDEDLILADYHLTYGQAKALLRILDPENSPGTPGDCGSRLRHVLGPPEDVNPLLRDIQENGVRGWRTLDD